MPSRHSSRRRYAPQGSLPSVLTIKNEVIGQGKWRNRFPGQPKSDQVGLPRRESLARGTRLLHSPDTDGARPDHDPPIHSHPEGSHTCGR
jgi:hypothetical protein